MIFRQPEPLSAQTEQLLAYEREFVAQAPDLRARVMARAHAASAVSPPLVRGWGFLPRGRVAPAAGLGVVVASVSFAAWYEAQSEVPVALTLPIATAIVERAQAIEDVLGPNLMPLEQGEPVPSEAPSPKAVHSPPTAPAASAESLELSLLQRARLALTRGEYATARREIAEHQRRFPDSPLREEQLQGRDCPASRQCAPSAENARCNVGLRRSNGLPCGGLQACTDR
jgi:hypothetical protein